MFTGYSCSDPLKIIFLADLLGIIRELSLESLSDALLEIALIAAHRAFAGIFFQACYFGVSPGITNEIPRINIGRNTDDVAKFIGKIS